MWFSLRWFGKPWRNFLLFSCSVVSNSLQLHGLQHARLPCPSLSPRVCSNSCPLSWWCHPAISSSVAPFSSCPQSFQTSGLFRWVWPIQYLAQSWRLLPWPPYKVWVFLQGCRHFLLAPGPAYAPVMPAWSLDGIRSCSVALSIISCISQKNPGRPWNVCCVGVSEWLKEENQTYLSFEWTQKVLPVDLFLRLTKSWGTTWLRWSDLCNRTRALASADECL